MENQKPKIITATPFEGSGHDGSMQSPPMMGGFKKCISRRRAARGIFMTGVASAILGLEGVLAEPWVSSSKNPYINSPLGLGKECTAYAFGRFAQRNGIYLTFTNPSGKKVAPHGGLMVPYADETAYVYRDSTPVEGALVSWSKGEYGHVAFIEKINSATGKIDISEQNWTAGKITNASLTLAEMKKRGSYTLAGYLNPNSPPIIGTLKLTKISTTSCRIEFPIIDNDGRNFRLLVAIEADGKTLGSGSKEAAANGTHNTTLSGLTKGKSYVFRVRAYDFRGLQSTTTLGIRL